MNKRLTKRAANFFEKVEECSLHKKYPPTMSNPTNKAGGLYGGIRFSSATSKLPLTASESAPKAEVLVQKISIPVVTQQLSNIDDNNNNSEKEGTKEIIASGATTNSGKAAAGIITRCIPLMLFIDHEHP